MAFSTNTGLAQIPPGIGAPLQALPNGQLFHAHEIVTRFSDLSGNLRTLTSDEICHNPVNVLTVRASTCQATGHVNDSVENSVYGTADDGRTNSSRRSETAQTDGQDNIDLANDNFTDEQPAVTRTRLWVEGGDEEPLSTNLAGPESSSEQGSCDDCWRGSIFCLILPFPIPQGLAEGAYRCKHFSVDSSGQLSCDVCQRWSIFCQVLPFPISQDLAEGAYLCMHFSAENSFQPTPRDRISFLTVAGASQHSSRSKWTHNHGNQGAASEASITQKHVAIRVTIESPDSVEQATSPISAITIPPIEVSNIPFTAIIKVFRDESLCEISEAPIDDGRANTAQEPTVDAPTENGHKSTMQEPTCDVPTGDSHENTTEGPAYDLLSLNGYQNTVQEPTCDVPACNVPTGNGYGSAMEEPTHDVRAANGHVVTAEEVTQDEGRVPSTASKWSWEFMRGASGMAGMYGGIVEASSTDGVPDQRDSAKLCRVRWCGIIGSLLLNPCSWFQPRSSQPGASNAEPGVPQTASDRHDGSSSSSANRSQAHQVRPAAAGRMPNPVRNEYGTFPTSSQPTQSSSPLVSQSSEHQNSTPGHLPVGLNLGIPPAQRRRATSRTPLLRVRFEEAADPERAGSPVPYTSIEDEDSPENDWEYDAID